MNAPIVRNSICFFVIGLCLALPMAATAGEGTRSVLDRVQNVDDPELEELIRIAIENSPEVKDLDDYRLGRKSGVLTEREAAAKAAEAARPKIVRQVTETYAQIKLLDSQLEQMDKKIHALEKAKGVQAEMILARAELEANRSTKLAELREIMNVVPRHAFGRIPAGVLRAWLVLEVLDNDIVHVFKKSRFGFVDRDRFRHYGYVDPVGVMSRTEVGLYLMSFMIRQENLPLRVAVCRNKAGIESSEELYKQILEWARQKKRERDVDVYLDDRIQTGRVSTVYLRQGSIYWSKRDLERNDPSQGGAQRLFEETIPGFFNTSGSLPLRLAINHDEESTDLAVRMSTATLNAAKELHLEHLVKVETRPAESDPNVD